MSKVLVTGATGFVGREVCRHLLQKGHAVIGTTRNQKLTLGALNPGEDETFSQPAVSEVDTNPTLSDEEIEALSQQLDS